MKENRLLTLIQKKRGFFEAILDLSEGEYLLSISDWVSSLEQKKILLSCVDEIDEEIHAYKDAFHLLTQEVSEELEHLRLVLEKILHLNAVNQDKRKKDLNIIHQYE